MNEGHKYIKIFLTIILLGLVVGAVWWYQSNKDKGMTEAEMLRALSQLQGGNSSKEEQQKALGQLQSSTTLSEEAQMEMLSQLNSN